MITALVVASVIRPARGGGKVGRGHPRGGGQLGGTPARFYAFPARPDAVASNTVITSVSRESLGAPIYVSTPVGNFIIMDRNYRSYIVTFCGYETKADLLFLNMTHFEVIFSMDWLSSYHVVLDFHAKNITLAIPELPRLEWRGSSISTSSRVISFLKARHMVEKGCLAYLAYVRDTAVETLTINSVPVVREFSDVFPSDLPGIPPDISISVIWRQYGGAGAAFESCASDLAGT
ncbi:uncharacterized protein [Nicotiana tomentosiformis]|uniref:uncharacterized protein n=1 Tax=Nicotiana tomentosiformis TaxID=4098 RepID=UPI00388CD636